ncbi:nucleolar protein 13 [Arthroderma uncinatum]|uniref:nucleolar protein 13 n=1 Tax=Arthroderma uncinatum TaxID=74035 RepID=UPI00144AA525|nr:nucleolar protein 13 [Arthroderma uncinatum]KAF3479902.1 nucleolar protein 13 [Arthroderma uncinatum]
MSDTSSSPSPPPPSSRKRKHVAEDPLEIDLNAPEPASKKALRKEKKAKLKSASTDATTSAKDTAEAGESTKPKEQEDKDKTSSDIRKQRTGFGIWIGNLPFSATREVLRTFLTTNSGIQDNEITRIHVPEGESRQKGVKRNKGFAYVDFTSQKVVDLALQLSEELVSGRRVLIKDATNFEGRPEKKPEQEGESSKPAGNPPSKKIFVGNLAFDTTKEDLEEHYRPCGAITHVHVATFEDSGKCKGYAWVEFESTESSEAAVRGFVKIPDPADEVEEVDEDAEEETSTKKPKKQREKKVWVNRLQGRQLRMEFAEDQSTRYKKRFGKEKTEGDENSKDKERKPPLNKAREPKKPAKYNSRYSNETVQRLSGAIVEAKGSKVTFD